MVTLSPGLPLVGLMVISGKNIPCSVIQVWSMKPLPAISKSRGECMVLEADWACTSMEYQPGGILVGLIWTVTRFLPPAGMVTGYGATVTTLPEVLRKLAETPCGIQLRVRLTLISLPHDSRTMVDW